MEFNSVLLISDLHLTPTMPRTAERFVDFCTFDATQVDALFILGDLFEYWVGDDAHQSSPFHREVAKQLANLSRQGTQVFFMKGNRDFLIGQEFAKQSLWTEIQDPSILTIGEHSWILSHGDSLCTADPNYQRFRTWTRKNWVQRLFLKLPLQWRKSIAEKLRRNSTSSYQKSQRFTPEIANIRADVTKRACSELVQSMMCSRIIHGHTHRSGLHEEGLDNISWKRWVLSDWDFDHPETTLPKGNALRITTSEIEFIDLVRT